MPILDLEYARNFCKFSQKIVLVQNQTTCSYGKKINLYSYHFKKKTTNLSYLCNVYLLFYEIT